MNLSTILVFPWFRKWELEVTFYADLKQWCWFNRKYISGRFDNKDGLAEHLGFESNTKWFVGDISILCFTFILEGLK